MSVIGSFSASGKEYVGEIATLAIRATNVRIAPVQRATDTGPNYRVYAGRVEIGAAWTKKSKEGKSYLSVLLDDPSLMAPFYASLVSGDEGEGHNLIWSRGSRRDCD